MKKNSIKLNNKKKNLGKIAHQFKTPLNTSIGQIEKIEDKYLQFDVVIDQKELLKDLNFIRYLSNYTVYLITD